MTGALSLTSPSHMLAKLDHEMDAFDSDVTNSYAAINVLRDAYHLREWIWHTRLEHNSSLLTQIIGRSGVESDWNSWVNTQHPEFKIVREICNGSKHFELDNVGLIIRYKTAGLNGNMGLSRGFKLNDAGDYIDTAAQTDRSVRDIAQDVQRFWHDLTNRFPALK